MSDIKSCSLSVLKIVGGDDVDYVASAPKENNYSPVWGRGGVKQCSRHKGLRNGKDSGEIEE